MKINPINSYNIQQNKNSRISKISFNGGRVLLAGSFDPPTIGHLDLVKVGAQIGDELIVAVGQNPKKNPFLSIGERIKLLKESIYAFDIKNKNIIVDAYENISPTVMNSEHIRLRGLRNSIESLEDEVNLDEQWTLNNPNIRTLFSLGRPEVRDVSSTRVRKLFRENGDFTQWVPKPVADYLNKLKTEGVIK